MKRAKRPTVFMIITVAPGGISEYLSSSIIGRAERRGIIETHILNPREFTHDVHRTVDDRPYGGGPGMVLMAEPLLAAIDSAKGSSKKCKTIIFSPGGRAFTNEDAREWARDFKKFIFIAGRYEGIDARVRDASGAEEISIGDYVLTGGELPALIVIDAISRHIPGVLGKQESIEEDRAASFDVYTRPESFTYRRKQYRAPNVLTTGDHAKIYAWRSENRKRGRVS